MAMAKASSSSLDTKETRGGQGPLLTLLCATVHSVHPECVNLGCCQIKHMDSLQSLQDIPRRNLWSFVTKLLIRIQRRRHNNNRKG